MGMFDSVVAPCTKCGGRVEFQSKAGACFLDEYPMERVPGVIAAEIDNTTAACDDCGTLHGIRADINLEEVPMHILELGDFR